MVVSSLTVPLLLVVQFLDVVAQTDQVDLHLDVLLATGKEAAEVVVLLDHPEGPLHLDGAVDAQPDPFLARDVSGRNGSPTLEGRGKPEGLVGPLRAAVALVVEGAVAAVHARIVAFRLFVAALQFPMALMGEAQDTAVLTDETVPLRVVTHVLLPADLLPELLALPRLMVLGLEERLVLVRCQEGVVLLTLVARIRHDVPETRGMTALYLLEEGDQGRVIGPIGGDAYCDNVLCFDPNLDVIGRFELPVPHVVILHMHERRVWVGLGEAVAVLAHLGESRVVAGLPLHIAGQFFIVPLQGRLPLPCPVDEADLLVLYLLAHPGEAGLQLFKGQGGGQIPFGKAGFEKVARFRHHLALVLFDGLAPDEGVAVGVGLHLGAVHEERFELNLLPLQQERRELGKEVRQDEREALPLEAGNGVVVGNGPLPLEEVEEMEAAPARSLQFPAGIDVVHGAIEDDLEKILR